MHHAKVLGGVTGDHGVGRHERQILYGRLGDHRAIEWILMNGRKVVDRCDVLWPEGQRLQGERLKRFAPPRASPTSSVPFMALIVTSQ